MSLATYRFHQTHPDEPFICLNCLEKDVPFQKLNEIEFQNFVTHDILESIENHNTINLTPTPSQQTIINKINNLLEEKNNFDNNDNVYHEADYNDYQEANESLNCRYVSCEEFVEAKYDANKNFSIIHLNIHSITLHIDDLRILLKALNYNFDIIALSESKLKSCPTVDITIEGYNPPLCTFTEAEKGGTILYVAKHINFKPRKDLEMYEPKLLESTFIEIINKKESNSIIGVVYRHPKMDTFDFNDANLNNLMHSLAKEHKKKIFLAGDFNFDLLKISTHTETENFYSQMTSNFLFPMIIIPTKINSKNDTLIDNIYSNQINSDTVTGNITVNISDGHLPSFTITPKPNQTHLPKKHNIYRRDYKHFDKDNFLLDLAQINWDDNLHPNDANKSFENFLALINNLVDKYLPLKKLSNKEFKLIHKPWITQGILKSIKRKDKMFRTYIKCKEENLRANIHDQYKSLRNQINELIRVNKKNYYQNYFTEHSSNIKKVWEGIKEVINIKDKNKSTPNCIEIDNKLITDPKIISENFNNYFSNIADNILKSEKRPILKTYDEFLNNPMANSFVFNECDPEEVYLLINELNSNKSSGPNGIPTNILQLISRPISFPLCKIYNYSILNGTHPDKLKHANIIPIFKKGSRMVISNYRPISLLSNLNKIFEKIIYKRMYSFLDKYNILFDYQFGFRSNHSTNHALISITEKIRASLDEDKVACGIFIDLQKAFDTVNHDILLKKLEHYGFRGIINKWLRSYLTDRFQQVSINGITSNSLKMKHGVPQGSVLGPLLFLIYINDLNLCIKYSNTYHFADDTNLLNINKSYQVLQKEVNKDLKSLVSWLSANKISLNKDKTEVIFFRKPLSKIPPQTKIKLNGKRIIPSKNIKYLGVILDEHLSGEPHANELLKKLNRANGLLAKARFYVPTQELINIYYAVFSSHMTYGCQIWTPKHNYISDKIFSVQKKAIRIMSFADKREHTDPLFKKLNILKFKDNLALLNTKFVHDFLKGTLPSIFVDTFRRVENIHSKETSQATCGKLFIPRYLTVNYGKKSISMCCINSWNLLTDELFKYQTETLMTKMTKKDLLTFSRKGLSSLINKFFLSTYSDTNKSYQQDRFYVSYISLTGTCIKLKKCKGPYYPPFNNKIKIKKILNDTLKYKIYRKTKK